jgi:dihydrofolate reductase
MMLILRSESIVSALTRLGLIDEYEFMANPAVLRRGRSQFAGLEGRLKMKLIKAETQCMGCDSWIPADELETLCRFERIKSYNLYTLV